MANGNFGKLTTPILAVLILIRLDSGHGACYRKPQGAIGDNSPVDENYQMQIDGNPTAYLPGQQYNLSLFGANGMKFISFTLLVEAESSESLLLSSDVGGEQPLGHFVIIDNSETRFSSLCENMIESSNTNGKNRINVAWVAPTHPQSGCVLFKAAILQHRDVWFIDDGFLTKRLCAEEIDQINSQTPPVDHCCACDEAKYEIILERKWRRNTHAKDFPSEPWRTKLGDIIGASHKLDYRFWEYGGAASEGLRELAEHGSTKKLENEIKKNAENGSIRTIIKAPGTKYRPNDIGKSLATVRVGPNHHVISLVLKIDPSPDWILGVSGLELCLTNCTWIEKKVLNLYPWDIGTDAGPSYMSPDQAQHPPDVIRRISSTFPSDYRSPFFDKTGAPMKPLATLYVNKKRTYGRECEFGEASVPLECSTHPWTNWTECTAKCGSGLKYRTRSYKDPRVADNFNCGLPLEEKLDCIGTECGIQQPESPAAECGLTNWSTWSECSSKCGKGFKTRTREYNKPYARERCQAGVPVKLQQTAQCIGENCGGNIYNPMDETNFKYESEQNTNWQSPQIEDAQRNYGLGNTEFRPQNPQNEDFEDVTNIYGKDRLVGGKFRPYHEHEATGNKNTFGNFDNKPFTNAGGYAEKDIIKKRPGFANDFCLEKPVAYLRPCNKKRLIVKNYWFYDADDNECKLFTADNCDENKNKFLSMEECLKICSQLIEQENENEARPL